MKETSLLNVDDELCASHLGRGIFSSEVVEPVRVASESFSMSASYDNLEYLEAFFIDRAIVSTVYGS